MWPYLRHYLGVVDEVLQRVAAGEAIEEVCGVADDSNRGGRGIDVAIDDDRLDGGELTEWSRYARNLVYNLRPKNKIICILNLEFSTFKSSDKMFTGCIIYPSQ